MALLQEQWAACEGIWSQSELYFSIKQSRLHRKKGCRKWMTRSEIAAKYSSASIAQTIVDAKESDEVASKTQVRLHPDCHGLDTPEARL